MIVLGLETSSRVCAVGLADDHGPLNNKAIVAGTIHSEKLLSLIESLLEENHLKLSQVEAIAVSSGPGSFTGLRIGFSAAKGLCFSTGKPLIVVSTFQALAHSAFQSIASAENILVALDAKKGDFYAGLFRPGASEPLPVGETILLAEQALSSRIPAATGTVILTDSIEKIRSLSGKDPACVDVTGHYRGEVVAHLGVLKRLRGESSDGVSAEPLYLKDFIVKGKGSSG
jgi:tRNA threonylcarbamoyladenosine biosynthesis protein TsaB